ncbi:hypothetical protein AKN87_08430 [Thiopseudomonas alkaliphila]|uniref:DUF4282 domain-containing protein n=1 Tax=Thiopseudomonas alkaliphila TaxID=1697053 RepID=UPI00069FFCAE|nr:DUF4282 domain-containing protein [Thiopseudomonas alkaliphila]AKX45116.1 hypothetical protein AKN87_08430 [Thiopseudomonas alkaliphila]
MKFNLKDIFFFNQLITLKISTYLYWFVLLVVTFAMIGASFAVMFASSFFSGLMMLLIGLPLALLYVRLVFELMLVFFKINQNLEKLVEQGKRND